MKDKLEQFLKDTNQDKDVVNTGLNNSNEELQPYMGVTLEMWANINARLANHENLENILDETGLNDIAWDKVNAEWLKRMSCNHSAEIAMQYSKAFVIASRNTAFSKNEFSVENTDGNQSRSIQSDLIPFDEWVKITEHLDIATERGIQADRILSQYKMNVAEWAVVGEYWVDKMNENAMEYVMEYNKLSEKYRVHFSNQDTI